MYRHIVSLDQPVAFTLNNRTYHIDQINYMHSGHVQYELVENADYYSVSIFTAGTSFDTVTLTTREKPINNLPPMARACILPHLYIVLAGISDTYDPDQVAMRAAEALAMPSGSDLNLGDDSPILCAFSPVADEYVSIDRVEYPVSFVTVYHNTAIYFELANDDKYSYVGIDSTGAATGTVLMAYRSVHGTLEHVQQRRPVLYMALTALALRYGHAG